MLTAEQARLKARNDMVVYNEIKAIELAIIQASSDGELDVTVATTEMTNGETAPAYYNEWKGTAPNVILRDRMNQVIASFTKLGYTLDRKTNQGTGDTFVWIAAW
jgi:hypothetical protein